MFSIKYKVDRFSDIFGHKKIVEEFIKRSETFNFPEVMFFIGEPGSGKTASASIISRLLNCKSPVRQLNGGFEPCNACVSCLDVSNEHFGRDIHLFNASQMGKDEVLKLEDLACHYPLYDKNIFILIDEAHELKSLSAKGATKKLLEKKRKNVYFILCTSDNEAFTPEIKRRGQVYLFNKVDQFEISDYLLNIIKKENIIEKIPELFITEGIFTISENCNGSPGYALSLLDRCISGEIYSNQEIIRELGLITSEVSSNLLLKILKKDKSVFADLKDMDLKEFFFKSFKILSEAFIYSFSGYVDQDWKEINAKKLIQNKDSLIKLLECFNAIRSDPYFYPTSFYFELGKYYNILNNSGQAPIAQVTRATRTPL